MCIALHRALRRTLHSTNTRVLHYVVQYIVLRVPGTVQVHYVHDYVIGYARDFRSKFSTVVLNFIVLSRI